MMRPFRGPHSVPCQFYRCLILPSILFVGGMALCGDGRLASAQSRPESEKDNLPAGNEKVAEIFREFEGRGVMSDGSQPTKAEQAVQQFRLRDGLDIDLMAAEPAVSQPLFLSWDSRGRMWVVQYRQYQYPAGLKVVRFDQHLRAVFDKVPEPPPHGTPGADRVTVFEDTDGDGRFDTHKDVLTELNIATSVQVGRGGIWVLNPPYLLFYPDADRDDVPDGEPEVRLSGFGLQDTHSVANSLLWGPDGWLYGASGSTTVDTISSAVTKGVHYEGQCIWRYHPGTEEFEIYAEGGGNTFSCEIDAKGRVFSGTNGGGTRGFYYPQGAYFQKNWGKHGPLTNPYAFGYFRQMDCEGDSRRFAQAFAIYEGGLLPSELNHTIVAPNAMCNLIWNSRLIPQGSYFRTVDNENLLETSDRWFRPVYAGVGPDGCVYVADWYDTRLSHVSPIDDWHKESGRVYRIRPKETAPRYRHGDLHGLPSNDLIQLFDDPNKWVRRRAVLELGWRGDMSVVDTLVQQVNQQASLESLWALSLLDQLSTRSAVDWLSHDDADIRRWVVRLLGDRHEGHPALAKLAKREPDVHVRSQLASAAQRVDTQTGLAIVDALWARSEDVNDPHMPLMIWWALESHAEEWPQIEALFSQPDRWSLPIVKSTIIDRIMQRYAAAGGAEDLQRCARLVQLAPDAQSRQLLIAGLNKAFQGRTLPELPSVLQTALDEYQASKGKAGIVLALRQGADGAAEQALQAMRDPDTDLGIRIELARALGQVHHRKAIDALLRLATRRNTREPAFQRVAIQSLSQYSDLRIAKTIAEEFDGSISAEHDLRSTACRTLASRKSWAKILLNELNQWRLKPTDVPPDVVQQLRTYRDPEVVAAVRQAFGKPVTISTPEKVAEIERLTRLLADNQGDAAAGEVHFTKKCANCHQLFGQGDRIAPMLDNYDRGNLKFWLPAIVAPSLEIREGYQSYVATLHNGRTVVGMIADQNPNTVTLRTADNQNIVMDRQDLDGLNAIATSLMPEDLLHDMSDQQIKDLFAYLMLGTRR